MKEIERLKRWAIRKLGGYYPEPTEKLEHIQTQMEIKRLAVEHSFPPSDLIFIHDSEIREVLYKSLLKEIIPYVKIYSEEEKILERKRWRAEIIIGIKEREVNNGE